MQTHVYNGSYSLMRRLFSLEGQWAGPVHTAEGTLVGREQISCSWDAAHRTFRVISRLFSHQGQVLGDEQADLLYDAGTDSVTALVQQGSGRTDVARGYANAQNELVLVSDSALRLRRFSWPAECDPTSQTCDTWHHCQEVATGGTLHSEWQAVLHRV